MPRETIPSARPPASAQDDRELRTFARVAGLLVLAVAVYVATRG